MLLARLSPALSAGEGGSLLGTITDPNGAAIPRAKVSATETATAVKQTITTDGRGLYSFQSPPVGRYDVQVDASGFKTLRRTDVVIDVDSKVVVDASLAIGERTDTVTVSESAAPLISGSFTDLLALQSGVVPVTSLTSDTTQDVGAAIVPNLDSIAEFRILTSNFDAEYGEFSGGPINVVTKSGTNEFHGDPRNGQRYFNAALFSENALGTPGDASRRYFHGPGMGNFDRATLKNLRLTESKSLQFRIEAFNVFNHAQFFGPQSVDGNISSATFGQVVSAAPRLVQAGAKLTF
jgi:hypothetical protein